MKLVILLSVALFACTSVLSQSIVFGDNTSEWANDGECDDRRFIGSKMARSLDIDDNARDATDCKEAHALGLIKLWDADEARAATQCSAISFGNNASEWSNDGECDDPRFEGSGSSDVINNEDIGGDATDCKIACNAGTVFLRDY